MSHLKSIARTLRVGCVAAAFLGVFADPARAQSPGQSPVGEPVPPAKLGTSSGVSRYSRRLDS